MNKQKNMPKISIKVNEDFYKTPIFIDAEKNKPKEIISFLKKEEQLFVNYVGQRKNLKILELGCGDGRIIDALIKSKIKNYKIIGVDNNTFCLESCFKKYSKNKNISIIKANILNLPFNENSFDVVICSMNTLGNFINKKQKLINEVYRVLKNKGVLLLSIYSKNILNLQKKWYDKFGNKEVKVTKDYYVTYNEKYNVYFISERFSLDKIKKLFKNFKIKEIPCTDISYFLELTALK